MQVHWIPKVATSAWHWLAQLPPLSVESSGMEGIAVPAGMAVPAELLPLAATWQAFLQSQRLPPARVYTHLVPLSAEYDTPRLLAEALLAKLFPPEKAAIRQLRWTQELSAVTRGYNAAYPQLAAELPLRVLPIREIWEAIGPGLLRTVGGLADPRLIPPTCKVLVVQPVSGGGGRAYPMANAVVWEGMLANPLPKLPEVTRLLWLALQLNLDLPLLAGDLPPARANAVGAWALVPVALAVAAELEQAECTAESVELAARHWLPPALALTSDTAQMEEQSATLWNWWQTYIAMRPDWPVALGALERMLG
ncbi:MAG: hypothetical protein SFX18_10815 [Pirellulales bacterium]|nr:hypothetical protein [Pirellulales bacterium]